jgi:hypothetical protein
MNTNIMKKLGFEQEMKMVEHNVCPGCCTPIIIAVDPPPFKDDLSWEEFFISGLCQACQDKTFMDKGA